MWRSLDKCGRSAGDISVHLEFFLEERSAEVVLKTILPKIVSSTVSRRFHEFRGKHNLLKQLPRRLKSLRLKIPRDWRIVVLIDEDRENCHVLKSKLEQIAHDAGFVTKSSAVQNQDFQIVNRLAIEELEAWFFGDPKAVRQAFPRVSKTIEHQAKYRNPDAIGGGTYEALERLLKRYYRRGLTKTAVAQKIASHMEPNRNRSRSFQVFIEGLKACVGESRLRKQ